MKSASLALLAAACLITAPVSAAGRITEFSPFAPLSGPVGITLGPDGNLWFTENLVNQIGRMAPNGTMLAEYVIQTPASDPRGIAVGPEGNIYFAEYAAKQIGIISSFTPPFPEYPTSAGYHPVWMATGPDNAVYFTVPDAISAIGRIAPSGAITEHAEFGTPGGTPSCVARSAFGILYTENTHDLTVHWHVASDSHEDTIPLTPGSGPTGCAFASDGAYWVAEPGRNKVLRFNGSAQEFPITAASGAGRMIPGPRGDVWFVESDVDRIAHVTNGGVVTEYALASGAEPTDIAFGPDGNLWITEFGRNMIARFLVEVPGEADGNGVVDVADVFYLINFLFAGGPPPKF